MSVRVEFLGMPRQYAGRDFLDVAATDVESALACLAKQLPELATKCLNGSQVRDGYLLGVNGRFDFDPESRLGPNDTIQLLSADVGGH